MVKLLTGNHILCWSSEFHKLSFVCKLLNFVCISPWLIFCHNTYSLSNIYLVINIIHIIIIVHRRLQNTPKGLCYSRSHNTSTLTWFQKNVICKNKFRKVRIFWSTISHFSIIKISWNFYSMKYCTKKCREIPK